MSSTTSVSTSLPYTLKADANGGAVLALDHTEHKLAALIGGSTIHRGDLFLTGEDGILIRGTVIGNIDCGGAVVIDKGASVFGVVRANYLHCAGKIAGAENGKINPSKQGEIFVKSTNCYYEGAELNAYILYGDEAPVLSRGIKMTGLCAYPMDADKLKAFDEARAALAKDLGLTTEQTKNGDALSSAGTFSGGRQNSSVTPFTPFRSEPSEKLAAVASDS